MENISSCQHRDLIIDFVDVNVVAERSIEKFEADFVAACKLIFRTKRFLSLLKCSVNDVVIFIQSDLTCCS